QRGAVNRVDGEIAVGAVTVADLFAVVEHRGLVLLALADHHHSAHRDRVHQFAYRVDRRAVAALFVPAAHPPAGRPGTGLGDPYQLEGQVAVWGFTAGPHLRRVAARNGGRRRTGSHRTVALNCHGC